MNTFFVSLDVNSAANTIFHEVVDGSVTGTLIDEYTINEANGNVQTFVFEKHYWRVSNRLTLTVIIDDLCGKTRIHIVSGGGGDGLLRFDWGAASSFAGIVENIMKPYIIG